MARGFESKSVESQQADERPRTSSSSAADREAMEQREHDQKRKSLETSRRRIQRELEGTHSETHRSALRNALTFLDEELKKLS